MFFSATQNCFCQEINDVGNPKERYFLSGGIGSGSYFLHENIGGNYSLNNSIFSAELNSAFSPKAAIADKSEDMNEICFLYSLEIPVKKFAIQIGAGPSFISGDRQTFNSNLQNSQNQTYTTRGIFSRIRIIYPHDKYALGFSFISNLNEINSYFAFQINLLFGQIK